MNNNKNPYEDELENRDRGLVAAAVIGVGFMGLLIGVLAGACLFLFVKCL